MTTLRRAFAALFCLLAGVAFALTPNERVLLFAGIKPVWTANFLGATSLPSGLTYTGASLATMFDSTGTLTYKPNNLVTYSAGIGGTGWINRNITVAQNATTAPDGTNTASKLQESNGLNFFDSYNYNDVVIGTNYTTSVYAKAAERSWIWVNGVTNNKTWFNLANGTVGTTAANTTATITSVGSGWYRISITAKATGTPGYADFGPASADNTVIYTGVAGNGVYVWGAQLEAVTYETAPRAYNATTSSAYYGPRFDTNPATLAPAGLLVEASSAGNLFTKTNTLADAAWPTGSTVTTVANALTSPDGTVTAISIADTNTPSQHDISQNVASVSGTTYTASFFVRAGTGRYITLTSFDNAAAGSRYAVFDLNTSTVTQSPTQSGTTGTGSTFVAAGGINIGGGWWRIYVTGSNTAAGNTTYHQLAMSNAGTYTPDIVGRNSYIGTGLVWYAWGAQLEPGSVATSYMPNPTASSPGPSRAADVVQLVGAPLTALQGAQGAAIVQTTSSALSSGESNGILSTQDTSSFPLYYTGTPYYSRSWNGSSTVDTAGHDISQPVRSGVTWGPAKRAVAANGVLGASDTAAFLRVAATSAYLGSQDGLFLFLKGTIAGVALYNRYLPPPVFSAKSVVGAPY